MNSSVDLVIGTSGDRKRNLTAETRRCGESRRNCDFSDHPITCDHQITRSLAVLRRAIQLIRATLREIFDESAYDRFLQRTKATRSFESYRAFTHERESAIARKPRCC
jgi:hypothetical protein